MKKNLTFEFVKYNSALKRGLFSLFFCLSTLWCIAQTVTGVVYDPNGDPAIGATIIETGTSNGTITDIDGNFTLNLLTAGNSVEISFVGFETQTLTLISGEPNSVNLREGVALDEVVVTALGISREKKGLTYAVDEVDGEQLSAVKDVNVINALQGKTPGLVINRSSSGVGGSTRVVLRGNSSLLNNDPLYVIDGIPMTNNRSGQQGNVFGGGVDSGDGISNINPDDIESMSVLKGASAAALYGYQAANGVILITTKKGKKGKPKVTISSSYTADQAVGLPELQYRYGQTAEGSEFSWGGATSSPDHVSGFFQTGNTFINSVSVSGGTENSNSYFSYANTTANGIMPTNELGRHNFAFRHTARFMEDKLSLSGSLNYINQNVDNRPAGGLYFNPLTGLYFFPRGLDFQEYADNFEVYSPARNTNVQNWTADRDIQQNPHWILNRNKNTNNRDRIIAAMNAKFKITDKLSIQARGNVDKSYDFADRKVFLSTQATLSDNNGRYIYSNIDNTQFYGDLLLTYANQISDDLSLDFVLGTSHTTRKLYSITADSKDGDLLVANKFGLQFFGNTNRTPISENVVRSKVNAVFSSAQLGYRSQLYLDVTARNDWSSALPGQSYFYPSVGVTAILSEMMDMKGIDFAKFRASLANVGNAVPPFEALLASQRGTLSNGQPVTFTTEPFPGEELQPESTTSLEFGLELKTLNNRLGLDFTYYKSNTENQFVNISAGTGTIITRYLVNAGNIQNSGIEAALNYDVVKNSDFNWNTALNFTTNSNKVIEIHPEYDDNEAGPQAFFITDEAVNSYAMVLQKGGAFGDIWGEKFTRDDQDRIVLDADGKPQKAGLGFVGNPNPDFTLGWYNSISYGNFSAGLLLDGRFGGEVISITQALLDEFGVSEASAAARDAGGVTGNFVDVDGNAVSSVPADVYYGAVGGRQGITEAYVTKATNIRLRELSLGYMLPNKILGTTAKVSLIGRNLFFLKNDAPYDPDVTASTGVGLQGIDIFSMPTTRSIGVNVTLDF